MVLAVTRSLRRCGSCALQPSSAASLPLLLAILHSSTATGGLPEQPEVLDDAKRIDLPELRRPLHVVHDQESSGDISLQPGPKLPPQAPLPGRTALDADISSSFDTRRLKSPSPPAPPPHATCDGFSCPNGMLLRPDPYDIQCASYSCTSGDTSRCCYAAPTSRPTPAPPPRDSSLPPVGQKRAPVGTDLLAFGALMLDRNDNDEQKAFDAYDVSEDGQLDVSEIASAAGQLNYHGSQGADDLLTSLDTNGDGRVTLDEFKVFDEEAKALQAHEQNGLRGVGTPVVNWSPGLPDDLNQEEQSALQQGAHRRRTLGGNSAPLAQGSVGAGSYVLWMRLGRMGEVVPTAWAGQYDPLDEGMCRSVSGKPPLTTTLENTPKIACQTKCSSSPVCFGFSWVESSVQCTHYKEPGLRGGGEKEGGAMCNAKIFLLVEDGVSPTGNYENAGSGKCLAASGADYPESTMSENVDNEEACASQCSESRDCFGYSWSMSNRHCYLWVETEIRASGSTDDGYECMVKVYEVAGDGDASASDDLPESEAPYIDLTQPLPTTQALRMPLGRTISTAPVLWTGNWQKLMPTDGQCMTSDGEEPESKFHDDFAEQECSDECAGDTGCFGFSWSTTRQCMIWMQPDLWGGGSKGNSFSCVVKQYGVVRESVKHYDVNDYANSGSGMCSTPWGDTPASTFMGKTTDNECRLYCDGNEACYGYSWQKSNGDCALHMEAGLRGDKSGYSDITCFSKTYNVMSPEGPAEAAPPVGGYQTQGYPPVQGASYGGPPMQARQAPMPQMQQMPPPNARQYNGGNAYGYNGGNAGYNGGNAYGGNSYNGGGNSGSLGNMFGSGMDVLGALSTAHAANQLHQHLTGSGNNHQQNYGGNGYGNNYGNNYGNGYDYQPKSYEASPMVSQQDTPYTWWTPRATSDECDMVRPSHAFPGNTPEQSQSCWGNGRKQPQLENCWEWNAEHNPKVCWYYKALDDMSRGWKGLCQGLQPVNTGDLSCEENCRRNPWCSIWQTKGKGTYVSCYQGLKGAGYDCQGYHSSISFIPSGAQRLQHGNVRVLMNLRGWEIHGLKREFDSKYYQQQFDATLECQNICYSNLECAYWIYSTRDGCLVEAEAPHKVKYPLTRQVAINNGAFARSVVAGEMIQHYCSEHDGEVKTTAGEDNGVPEDGFSIWPWDWNWFDIHMPWDEGGWSWWVWLINITFCCCYCGCCCTLFICAGACKKGIGLVKGEKKPKEDAGSSSDSDSDSDEEKPARYKSNKVVEQQVNHLAQGYHHQAMHAGQQRPLLAQPPRYSPYS